MTPIHLHSVSPATKRSSPPFRDLNGVDRAEILASWGNGATTGIGGGCSRPHNIVPARRASSGVVNLGSPVADGPHAPATNTATGPEASLRFALLASWELGTADADQRMSRQACCDRTRQPFQEIVRSTNSVHSSPSRHKNAYSNSFSEGATRQAGMISLSDWANGAKQVHSARSSPSANGSARRGKSEFDPLSDDLDSSLRDLLAPLVTECNSKRGRIAPPDPLNVQSAFAAISAVGLASADQPASHFASARKSLATSGFRRCDIVIDKLGVSVRCLEDVHTGESKLVRGFPSEQIDFPWSSVSDVQDPRTKKGLQGHAVMLGVREPSSLAGEPSAALCLVLRLPDRSTAQKLADVALAFKVYEVQTAVWNTVGRHGLVPARNNAALLLDERGIAFWSLSLCDEPAMMEAPRCSVDVIGNDIVFEAAAPNVMCCGGLCWC